MRYAIRRVSPMGALLYGLLLGLGGWLIPGALLGWLVRAVVLGARSWLGGLQLFIPLPLEQGITLDLGSVPALATIQTRLTALAGQELTLVLAVALGTAAAGMLLTGLTAFLAAIFYNLFASVFGGLEMKLEALDVAEPRAVPPSAVPAARQPAPAPVPVAAPRPRPEPFVPPVPVPAAWLTSPGGERRLLRDNVTRVGSAPENDIVLPGLAAQHAEIRRESGRYLIYDLGSRRTWVNDDQVAAVHMLKDGFRLQLGQTEFIVHIQANQQGTKEAA
ncbi:MAG: FHA domain-containing protein [Candidatus Promineofilum sp.]|nr:FHA domain-containing protein [Promineifilum sp.]